MFFKPDKFRDNPYGYLTNEISHVAVSLFIVYWLPVLAIPLLVCWLLWELYHLYLSKDWVDYLEDLFYEWSGIICFFYPWWSFLVAIILAVRTYAKYRANKQAR